MAKRKSKVNEIITTYFNSQEERRTFVKKYSPKFDNCIVYWSPVSGFALEAPEALLKKTG